uniref:receptor protein-tyrosine kinase n=1 Tax=Acrobeloides nanus TaxID=290746 RepID=A0A914DQX7_9BILA
MPAIESQNLPICDENSGGFSLVPGGYKQVDYVYLENDDTKQRSSDIIILDNELQRNELLGEGNFSEVYKGLFREKEVAIKVIIADDETKAAIREEYKIMLKTSHPHIHSLLGISMGHVLQLGMKYLVEQGIVHRDLAARNILVKTIDHVEVSDFGLAKIIGHKKGIRIGGPAPWRWLAIESLTKCEFTYATDVWSYGVTCWEIFHFGIRVPYDDNTIINKCKDERYRKDELLKQLCHGERLRRPEKCDMKTYVELVSCWERNPTDRPTFDDLSTYFHEIELQMKDNEHDYKNVSTTKIHYAEIGPPKTDQHTDHYAIQIEKNYVQKSTTNEETSNQNANCDIQIATNTTICCKKPDRIAMDKIDNDELMAYSEQDNLSPTSIDSGISITSNSSNIEKEQ